MTGMENTDHIKNYHLESTWVSSLEKPKTNAFSKDVNGGFIQTVLKGNKTKLGPGHYKPENADTFIIAPKRIHFPISKAKRTTLFEENAKNHSWVPSACTYEPKYKEKVLGSEKS